MVMLKYIDKILNWFSMETPRKGSCRMEEVEARLSVSQHLMSKMHEQFLKSCTPCYVCRGIVTAVDMRGTSRKV